MGHQVSDRPGVTEVRELYGISPGEQMTSLLHTDSWTWKAEPLTMLFQHQLKWGKERYRTLVDTVHEKNIDR